MNHISSMSHLASRIFGTPLLIHPRKLDVILSVVGPRLGLAMSDDSQALIKHLAAQAPPVNSSALTSNIAVISVSGTLVRRAAAVDAASGLTSYAVISAQLAQAVRDPAVNAILLDIDSPGGEAGGAFDLADQIMAARQIKPIWAVANDDAFSAAYAIASAASRVYVTRTGGVGSVGVIALHVDQSQRDAMSGLRYTAVYAGDRKNDMSPHAPLSTDAAQALQAEVDRLYGLFVSTVAANRNLSAQDVQDTEAGLYFAQDAIDAGLADAVGTLDDALLALSEELRTQSTSIARIQGSGREMGISTPGSSMKRSVCMQNDATQAADGQTAQEEQQQSQPADQASAGSGPSQDSDDSQDAGGETSAQVQTSAAGQSHDIKAASAQVLAIAEMCLLAGKAEMTAGLIERGVSVDQARKELLAAKASASPEISSRILPEAGTQTQTKPEDSPVVRAAKQRAQNQRDAAQVNHR
jgi:signal peptide peptidase SppA